jgi:hypothetical protein
MEEIMNENMMMPQEIINLILFKYKGLIHPTASIMNEYIEAFLYMNGEYKHIDEKNLEGGENAKNSYFIWNAFHNFGFW